MPPTSAHLPLSPSCFIVQDGTVVSIDSDDNMIENNTVICVEDNDSVTLELETSLSNISVSSTSSYKQEVIVFILTFNTPAMLNIILYVPMVSYILCMSPHFIFYCILSISPSFKYVFPYLIPSKLFYRHLSVSSFLMLNLPPYLTLIYCASSLHPYYFHLVQPSLHILLISSPCISSHVLYSLPTTTTYLFHCDQQVTPINKKRKRIVSLYSFNILAHLN